MTSTSSTDNPSLLNQAMTAYSRPQIDTAGESSVSFRPIQSSNNEQDLLRFTPPLVAEDLRSASTVQLTTDNLQLTAVQPTNETLSLTDSATREIADHDTNNLATSRPDEAHSNHTDHAEITVRPYQAQMAGLSSSDYSDAPIHVIAAKTLEIDNTFHQNLADLTPRGRFSQFTQVIRARLASLVDHGQAASNWKTRALKYNGTTDAEVIAHAAPDSTSNLREQFGVLNQSISDLNTALHGYKNLTNKKVSTKKVDAFKAQFENILNEQARLHATINNGSFLEGPEAEANLADNMALLAQQPLITLDTAIAELREIFVAVSNIGSKNAQALVQNHDATLRLETESPEPLHILN